MQTDLRFRYVAHVCLDPSVELRHLRPAEPLYGHVYAPTRLADLHEARALHEAIGNLVRQGPLWTAIRALWAALGQTWFHNRYALLWTALEALFGPQEGDAVTFRVSQNLAFFLAVPGEERGGIFRDAKRAYGKRSKVVHGEHEAVREEEFRGLVAEAQGWLQRAILLILQNAEYSEAFRTSRGRDEFMERLVLSGG